MSLKEAGHEEYLAARKLLAEWFITCKSLYAVLLNYTVIYINKKQKKKKNLNILLLGIDENFPLSRQRKNVVDLSLPVSSRWRGESESGVLEAPGVGAEVGAGRAGCSSPTGVVAVRRGRL